MSLFCNDVHSAAAAGHRGVHMLPVLAARLAHRVDHGLHLRPLAGNKAWGGLSGAHRRVLSPEGEETSPPAPTTAGLFTRIRPNLPIPQELAVSDYAEKQVSQIHSCLQKPRNKL